MVVVILDFSTFLVIQTNPVNINEMEINVTIVVVATEVEQEIEKKTKVVDSRFQIGKVKDYQKIHLKDNKHFIEVVKVKVFEVKIYLARIFNV